MMKPGDKVVIGGRTRLGAMSLVGMTGTLTGTAPNAPVGNLTVLGDWEEAGFTAAEIEDLPAMVNVPLIFLTPAEKEEKKEPESAPPSGRPHLRLV